MRIVLKFLLRFNFFRKSLLRAAYHVKYSDIDEMAKLEFAFSDSKGKKYYKYIREDFLPLERYEQLQIRLLEMESRISRESLLEFSKVLKKYAENKDFIRVALLIGQLEERLNLIYDPELMMRLLSGIYIREDQVRTAHIWNGTLEEEKFKQLMKDNDNGSLSFFFQKSDLMKHLRFQNTLNIESEILLTEEIIQNQNKEARLFDKMVTEI